MGIFYGWWVLVGSCLLAVYGAGSFLYGFSTFVHPVVREMGWSMALTAGAFSVARLEAGISAPLSGYILDRFGPRKMVIAGGLVTGSGFICLSQVSSVAAFYSAIFVISMGYGFCSGMAVGSPLVGKWFVRKRGAVLGISMSAFGLGGLLVPGLVHLIESYGWRTTLLIMGPFTYVYVTSVAFFLRDRPEHYGLLPDGEPVPVRVKGGVSPGRAPVHEADFTLRQALRTASFWLLIVCFVLYQLSNSALFVHLVPCIVTMGRTPHSAGLALSLVTLISILGRLGFGWLGDRLNKKWLLVLTFLLQGLGILGLSYLRSPAAFLVAYGPSYGGCVVLRASITGEYFGRSRYGTIYGLLQGISVAGGVAGPVLVGLAYDTWGNYDTAMLFLAGLAILAALLMLPMRRPSVSAKQENLSPRTTGISG